MPPSDRTAFSCCTICGKRAWGERWEKVGNWTQGESEKGKGLLGVLLAPEIISSLVVVPLPSLCWVRVGSPATLLALSCIRDLSCACSFVGRDYGVLRAPLPLLAQEDP
eukprot:9321402-Pyramimonas_sp.AAC.1